MEKYQKIDEKFRNLLCDVFSNYFIWKYLREYINEWNETSKLIDDRYSEFFVPVLFALEDRFLLGLANLLDKNNANEDRKVICIYELLEFVEDIHLKDKISEDLRSLEIFRNKFLKWRNKILAHKDYWLAINWYEDFTKKYSSNFWDIYNVMISLWEIYDSIHNTILEKNISTDFTILEDTSIGLRKLFIDLQYFVPKTENERIEQMMKINGI